MKLASLKKGRDGELLVVDRPLRRAVRVPQIAPTLQFALDHWESCSKQLEEVSEKLNRSQIKDSFDLRLQDLASPLPRAYQWVDGSAYVTHVELVRKARGAEMPPSFWTDPLMYQGCSDSFIGPCDPVPVESEEWGIDLEAEVAVVTDDVPMGIPAAEAGKHIKLLMLVNDVTLRNLVPNELAKGFGFLQSKPASSFSPVAVTPDELGKSWQDYKVHLPLVSKINGELLGKPEAGKDMTFNFATLVAHAAKTRLLCAGTILGSGTISNSDRSVGSSCLAEKRMIETIEKGKPVTPFLKFGDRVKIEMFDQGGNSIFGAIDQEIKRYVR